MKNLKIIILSVISLFIMSSCTKIGKNITIKGKVLNPLTGEPIPGTEIALIKMTLELPGGPKAIKSVISESDGSFELNKLSLRAEKIIANTARVGTYYALGWYKDGKYITNGTSLPIKRGKKLFVDFHAVPYGKLQMNIKNINCESPTDSMWFKMKYQYDKEFIPKGWDYAIPYVGCTNFVANGWDQEQMGNHIIQMKIKRPSGEIIKFDTVFVKKEGITFFDLEY